MSAGHTQRLLVVSSQDDMPTGAAQFDGVTAHPDLFVLYHDNAKADACRLVACWNACNTVSTEDLEIIADAGENFAVVRERFVTQRDELIEAAQQAAEVMNINSGKQARSRARAKLLNAIAKATGGTPA